MLGKWREHADYQQYLIDFLKQEREKNPQSIKDFETSILKLYMMNLDSVKTDFAGLFSGTGRPSNQQPEMFRALVLMSDQLAGGFDGFVKTARATPLFCALVGVDAEDFPAASTLRDFISRFWMEETPDRVKTVEVKPKGGYGKEKKPPNKPGVIKELADKALAGATFGDIPEALLQTLFTKTAVKPSVEAGLIPNPDKLTVSADGTCIESHASPNGVKTETENLRRFADPNASWGWDSYHERWFYGYTGYFLSTYNPQLKLDLPLYLRFEKASAFDGVTLIKALSHARSLWNGFLNIDSLLADSAHDNLATYNLLAAWKIKTFIDLKPSNSLDRRYDRLTLSASGAPICADGYEMTFNGFCRNRYRKKYRCPLMADKIRSCPYFYNCNRTPYGKTTYVRVVDNPRFLTPVPRGSDQWNAVYSQRTAAERVNNRILTDYQLERPKRYGDKKLAFFAFMDAINIHLDALVKFGSLNIDSLIA